MKKLNSQTSKEFTEEIIPDEVQGFIDEIALMIVDERNVWVRPYLLKQMEAFELLKNSKK